jgi:glycine cleavage system protein P-like pyridoxal-binding family
MGAAMEDNKQVAKTMGRSAITGASQQDVAKQLLSQGVHPFQVDNPVVSQQMRQEYGRYWKGTLTDRAANLLGLML